LLSFLAIFIPLLVRTNDLALSLGRAIPLFFICMCTFIANALDDVERDKVNHPERPLPSRKLTPMFATVLYFASLGASLFSTRYYVAPDIAFWYYALITLSISYGYIVDCLPGFKAPYVAVACSMPVLIVAAFYPDETRLYILAVTVFLFTIGREICADIRDRDGDAFSFMHRFRPRPLAIVAFTLQTIGLLLLTVQIGKPEDIIVLVAITFLLVLSGIYWFKFASYKGAIILMRIPFFVGLYFLT
jgi:geranylgeranylglycerol-phosphate geranylgeranyltransferase